MSQAGRGSLKGWARWFKSVIPALGSQRQMDHLRSGVGEQPGQHGKTVSIKNTKISQAWQHTPVVPATSEPETGESFEPRRRRLQ